MKEKRIVISLPESTAHWLGHEATRSRNSRKAFIEALLISRAEEYRSKCEGKTVSKNQLKIK